MEQFELYRWDRKDSLQGSRLQGLCKLGIFNLFRLQKLFDVHVAHDFNIIINQLWLNLLNKPISYQPI